MKQESYEVIYDLCPTLKNIHFEKISASFDSTKKKFPIEAIIDITDMDKPYASGLYIYHLYSIILTGYNNINITGYRLARFLYDSANRCTDKLIRTDKWNYKMSEFKLYMDPELNPEEYISKKVYPSASTGNKKE